MAYEIRDKFINGRIIFGQPEQTIDLVEFDGVFRKPEPHENIHDPEYYEAIREHLIDTSLGKLPIIQMNKE